MNKRIIGSLVLFSILSTFCGASLRMYEVKKAKSNVSTSLGFLWSASLVICHLVPEQYQPESFLFFSRDFLLWGLAFFFFRLVILAMFLIRKELKGLEKNDGRTAEWITV